MKSEIIFLQKLMGYINFMVSKRDENKDILR
jgi:hypothetical protein